MTLIFSLELLCLITFLDWTNYGLVWPRDKGTKRFLKDNILDKHGLNSFRHFKNIRDLFHFLKLISPEKRLWSMFILNQIGYAHWIRQLQESCVFALSDKSDKFDQELENYFEAEDIVVAPRTSPYSNKFLMGIINPGQIYPIVPFCLDNRIRSFITDPDEVNERINNAYVYQREVLWDEGGNVYILNDHGGTYLYDFEIIGTDIDAVSLSIYNNYNNRLQPVDDIIEEKINGRYSNANYQDFDEAFRSPEDFMNFDILNKPNGFVGSKKIKWQIRPFRYISNFLSYLYSFNQTYLCIRVKRKLDNNDTYPIYIKFKQIYVPYYLLNKRSKDIYSTGFEFKINKFNTLSFTALSSTNYYGPHDTFFPMKLVRNPKNKKK